MHALTTLWGLANRVNLKEKSTVSKKQFEVLNFDQTNNQKAHLFIHRVKSGTLPSAFSPKFLDPSQRD